MVNKSSIFKCCFSACTCRCSDPESSTQEEHQTNLSSGIKPTEDGAFSSSTVSTPVVTVPSASSSVTVSALTTAICEDAKNVSLDASSPFATNCPHDPQNSLSTMTAEDGAVSSASSSSVKMSANVCEDAKKDDLAALTTHISELLEAIKEKKSDKNMKQTRDYLSPTTIEGCSKLNELLLQGKYFISSLKDNFPSHTASTVAQEVLKEIGQVHWAAAGLLVVSNILERFNTVSENEKECLSLLEEMYMLGKHISGLKAQVDLREIMKETIKDGTQLIVEASLMCCHQIDSSKFKKFFSTSVDGSELLKFKEKLQRVYRHNDSQMILNTYVAVSNFQNRMAESQARLEGPEVHPRKQIVRPYPENTVGIEEPLKEVMKLLEWESDKKALAVILHGIGGMGKTTLAEAVFAQNYIEGCRFSKVIVDDETSTPDIVKLQKVIIKDLKMGEEIPDIRTSEGREGEGILDLETTWDRELQIGQLLEKNVVIIYIDNVSKKDSLQQLLPSRYLGKAKKLRVLITTRKANVLDGCSIDFFSYPMKKLNSKQGLTLLNEKKCKVTDDIKGQLDKIVEICDGIPILLKIIAGSIHLGSEDFEKNIETVMEDMKGWKGDTFREIDKRLLGSLPEECREPFLDICWFFKGWEWETVANIVGISELGMLERRALVSKDKNMTVSVHDVILDMGKKKAENTRFELTSATPIEIKQFLRKETKDFQVIKGLMLGHQSLPAEKFNLMHESLRIFAHKEEVDRHSEKLFEELLFYKGEDPHFPFEWWQLTKLRFLNCRPQNLNLLKEIPLTLTHIELDGSLCSPDSEISDSDIQRLKHLRVLRLRNFENWKNLAGEWGADVIESLKELTLSNCTSIEQLTGSISMLKNLKILNLEHCSSLKQLPDDFGSLSSLKILKFSHCYFLEELPKSISELRKLKIMTMNFCNIRRLPKDCESLSSSLTELNLRSCPSLKALPRSLGNALDSKSSLLFEYKGVLSDSPQSESDSDYESDTD